MRLGSLDRVNALVSSLDQKLREGPLPAGKDELDALYNSWSVAMLSALAVQDGEGNTEAVMTTLCALYRQGARLGVEGCADKAPETLSLALEMYPDSTLLNWQAVYLYSAAETPEKADKLEGALVRLRWLLASNANFEVEKRLAALYVKQERDKPAFATYDRAKTQLAHCAELRPGDASLIALQGEFNKLPIPADADGLP